MKKKKLLLLSMVVLSLLLAALNGMVLAGDWEDEIRVTQDPVEQNGSKLAAAPDDTLYLIWPEDSAKQISLYLITSKNKGGTWSSPSMILGPDIMAGFDLAADAAGLHLTFVRYDSADDSWRLYYTKSTDEGLTFSTPIQMGSWTQIWKDRIYDGDGRLMVYARDGTGGHRIFLSTDGGTTWQEEALLPGFDVDSLDFLLKGTMIHVAFGGIKNAPISYSRSADGGVTWSQPASVSSGAGPHSQCPSIAVGKSDFIHIAWEDDREGTFNVMYTRSTDGGSTWSNDLRLNDTYYGARTRLCYDEEGLHVLWCQFHGPGWPGNWGSDDYGIIWYKFGGHYGDAWSDEFRVSQNESIPPIQYPDLGANYAEFGEYGNGLCAWWLDKRDGNIDVYLRNDLYLLLADSYTISAMKGGTVNFALDAGSVNAGRNYFILGSVTGTEPGFPLPGGKATLPLNWDVFTGIVFKMANTPALAQFYGPLDGTGCGTAQLNTGPLPSSAVGADLYFGYLLYYPFDFTSNAVVIEIGL